MTPNSTNSVEHPTDNKSTTKYANCKQELLQPVFKRHLRQRRLVGEMMDDPQLDAGLHRQALDGLARANRVSFSAGF